MEMMLMLVFLFYRLSEAFWFLEPLEIPAQN